MRRVTCAELLDDDLGTPEEIAKNFVDLWRINRWLGGVSSNFALLEAFFLRTGRRAASVLELGAGDGRLAACLRERLRKRGVETNYVILDRRLSHICMSARAVRALKPLVADACALPFHEDSFDVVTCNLLLHHFSDAAAVTLLRSMVSVAREAVLIGDLERHPLPYWFVRATPWFITNRVSRHDGAASVRQAYTESELRELVRAAGFSKFEVRRFAPFRLGVTIWKERSRSALDRVARTSAFEVRGLSGGTKEVPQISRSEVCIARL